MSSRFNILFPIEIFNREIDFRLWLAVLAARPTNRIFIGFQEALYRLATTMRGGAYVGKNLFLTAFPTDLSRYHRLKSRGFTLVHLDDEGQVGGETPDEWRLILNARLDPSCLASDDYICAWGTFQRDHFAGLRPDLAAQIRATGHPRFDLYKPAYRAYFAADVAALRDRFGEFVLINTNMATANCGLGIEFPFGHFHASGYNIYGYSLSDAASRANHFGGWAHQTQMVAALGHLVNALSMAFPRTNFVLRPHPGEDWTFYEHMFRGIANVHVIHEGPVSPWLLASRMLIQENCTTALEGHLGEIPTVNYQPDGGGFRWKNSFWMASLFGTRLTSEREVIEAVGERLAGGFAARRWDDVDCRAVPLMENFRSDAVAACVDVLGEVEGRRGASGVGPSPRRVHLTQLRRRAGFAAKSVVRPLFPWKQRLYTYFTTRIFKEIDRTAVAAKLETIQRITGKRVSATFFGPELMSIELTGRESIPPPGVSATRSAAIVRPGPR